MKKIAFLLAGLLALTVAPETMAAVFVRAPGVRVAVGPGFHGGGFVGGGFYGHNHAAFFPGYGRTFFPSYGLGFGGYGYGRAFFPTYAPTFVPTYAPALLPAYPTVGYSSFQSYSGFTGGCGAAGY